MMSMTKLIICDVEYSGIELVDSKVVSMLTGLSVRTIQDKASKREIPVHKIGERCNRYRINEILQWIEDCRVNMK